MLENLLPPKKAAKILDINPSTLWRLQKAGEITYIRVGNSVKYRPSDLQAYIESNERGKARHQPNKSKT
ncbi:MAG: helix-turn-helix domain-containing protein [Acidobacteria bacterium]|nr:helix-turn-helix domain-containing protein [Acidobacteriota bacterium]